MYAPFATSPEQLEKFKVAINDPEFANQFAIAITAHENFDADTVVDVGDWDSTYESKGLADQNYEPSSAFNALIGSSRLEVVTDTNGNDKFKPTTEYTTGDNNTQIAVYDQTIRKILEAPSDRLSEDAKQRTLDALFKDVPNPRGLEQLDYLMAMKEDREELINSMKGDALAFGPILTTPLSTPAADYLKKKESTDPEQFQQELTDSKIASLSRPYTPKTMTKNIVSDALDIATSISTKSSEYNARTAEFFKWVANYESDYGTDEDTFRTDPDRATGFAQMIPNESIKEVREVLNPELKAKRGGTVRKYNQMVIDELGPEYDLSQMTNDDMKKPLHHALMARAYLLRIDEPLPKNKEEWGRYYQDYWNTGDAYGDHTEKFLIKNGMYIPAMKGYVKSLLGRD